MNKPALRISIGILAHNEERVIERTLLSLTDQDLFGSAHGDDREIEVVAVPNGCTDATEAICAKVLPSLLARRPARTTWKVCSVTARGKSNAWNLYVHDLSSPRAELLLLMDADIEIVNPATLRGMVELLEESPEVWVATSRPLKDVALRRGGRLMDRLSRQVDTAGPHAISGSLYCARSRVLRRIWLPPGLPVEDGFVRAMVLTNCFTSPERFERVRRAPDATHVFEAYTGVGQLLNHEKRLIIGNVINGWIFRHLWATCSPDLDGGTLIRGYNERNPAWVHDMVRENLGKAPAWWIVPPTLVTHKMRSLFRGAARKLVLRLPLALAGSVAYLLASVMANQELRRNSGVGYWK